MDQLDTNEQGYLTDAMDYLVKSQRMLANVSPEKAAGYSERIEALLQDMLAELPTEQHHRYDRDHRAMIE